jgi:hypothetical protein
MTGRIPIPNRVQAFSDWYGDGGCAPYERMQKIDERVSYREATDAENAAKTNCYNCRYYGWGDCNLVEGTVEASWLCDLFTKQPEFYLMELYDVAGGNHAVRLNVEQLRFKAADGTVTAPEWIQYWPAPGRFNHPTYGEIVITTERNARIVDNFVNKRYTNPTIPIDCDHNLAVSGAVGFIDDMRIAADGSIEAHCDWNEAGIKLIEQDRFRYFSPSIMPLWSHTVTGELIADVAVGGAICNDPYFTEPWLRPLVATRDGGLSEYVKSPPSADKPVREVRIVDLQPRKPRPEEHTRMEGDEKDKEVKKVEAPAPTAGVALNLSADQATALQEFIKAGGLATFSTMQETVKQQAETIQNLTNSNRDIRFRELVSGVEVFADGTRKRGPQWAGEVADHLAQLAFIADHAEKGEESEQFATYLKTQRAAAAQTNRPAIFRELGHGEEPEGDSATEAVGERAKKIVEESGGKISFRQAMSQIEQEDPASFSRYREESEIQARSKGRRAG